MEGCSQWVSKVDGCVLYTDDVESDSGKQDLPTPPPGEMIRKQKETIRCTFCTECFANKKKLLKHLRKSHDILQLYQCISCSKRFASGSSLKRHLELYCKRIQRGEENVKEYSLPAFLVNVRTGIWIPTYGDMLTCSIVGDDNVRVSYNGNMGGDIPYPLRATFADFLIYGTIHAKVAGALINRGHGEKVPVDYLFISMKHIVNNVISELESC